MFLFPRTVPFFDQIKTVSDRGQAPNHGKNLMVAYLTSRNSFGVSYAYVYGWSQMEAVPRHHMTCVHQFISRFPALRFPPDTMYRPATVEGSRLWTSTYQPETCPSLIPSLKHRSVET